MDDSSADSSLAALQRRAAADRRAAAEASAALDETFVRLRAARDGESEQRRATKDLSLRLSAAAAERDELAAQLSEAWRAAAAAEETARRRDAELRQLRESFAAEQRERAAQESFAAALAAQLSDAAEAHRREAESAAAARRGAEETRAAVAAEADAMARAVIALGEEEREGKEEREEPIREETVFARRVLAPVRVALRSLFVSHNALLQERHALAAHIAALTAQLRGHSGSPAAANNDYPNSGAIAECAGGGVSHFEALVVAARALSGAAADARAMAAQRRALMRYAAALESRAATTTTTKGTATKGVENATTNAARRWRRAFACVVAVRRLLRTSREVVGGGGGGRWRLPRASRCAVRGGSLRGAAGAAAAVGPEALPLPKTQSEAEVLRALAAFVARVEAERSRTAEQSAAPPSRLSRSDESASAISNNNSYYSTDAPAASAFATEVLSVIRALDQHVVGALERHARR